MLKRWGIVLLLAAPVHAQFFEFLADWSNAAPSDTRAFTAEITATLKARSPWGEIATTESGTYWRSRDGADRYDDSHGVSMYRDRRTATKARIDRTLELVEIERRAAGATPAAPWSVLPFNARPSGEREVEGIRLTVLKGSDHGVDYEVWVSDGLGVALYAKYTTDTTVFEQRVHNLRFVEPPTGTVELRVPEGFHKFETCWPEGSCQ